MISRLLSAEWKQSSEKESESARGWVAGQRTAAVSEFYKKQLMEYKEGIQKHKIHEGQMANSNAF